jgi:hypothetical protein
VRSCGLGRSSLERAEMAEVGTGRADGEKVLGGAGKFAERDLPDYSKRNWIERGFTIGIGG